MWYKENPFWIPRSSDLYAASLQNEVGVSGGAALTHQIQHPKTLQGIDNSRISLSLHDSVCRYVWVSFVGFFSYMYTFFFKVSFHAYIRLFSCIHVSLLTWPIPRQPTHRPFLHDSVCRYVLVSFVGPFSCINVSFRVLTSLFMY